MLVSGGICCRGITLERESAAPGQSADDFINSPELGIAEQQIKQIKNGRFILIPASLETHGHGTHTYAAVWQQYLKQLLDESQH